MNGDPRKTFKKNLSVQYSIAWSKQVTQEKTVIIVWNWCVENLHQLLFSFCYAASQNNCVSVELHFSGWLASTQRCWPLPTISLCGELNTISAFTRVISVGGDHSPHTITSLIFIVKKKKGLVGCMLVFYANTSNLYHDKKKKKKKRKRR